MNIQILQKQSCKFLIDLIIGIKKVNSKKKLWDLMDAQLALRYKLSILNDFGDWSKEAGLAVKTVDGRIGEVEDVRDIEPKIIFLDKKEKVKYYYYTNEIKIILPSDIFSRL